MQTKHLSHKMGATITAIDQVGHSTEPPGVANWYFIGELRWPDGKTSNGKIPPYAVCYDSDNPESKAELDKVMGSMNDYLAKHGKWHKGKWVGDHLVSWTPKRKKWSAAID